MSDSRQLESADKNGQVQRFTPTSHAGRLPRRPAAGDDLDITLGFLWGVWSQWWKLLLPVSLVLATVAALVILALFQPRYRADARLEIAEQSPWVIYRDHDPKAMHFVETQIEMLRSPRVLNAVLGDPQVASMPELQKKRDPVAWLIDEGLEIKPVGESMFVSLAYEGPDRVASAHLVNTVIDKYFRVQNGQKNARTQKILAILNAAKQRQEAEVARLQERVKELGKNLPDLMPNLTRTDVVLKPTNPLRELFEKVMAAEMEMETLEAQVSALQASLENDSLSVSEAIVQAETDALPEIQIQRLELQQEEAKLPSFEATAKQGKASPAYISQQKKIQRLRSMLEVARASSRETVLERVMASDLADRKKEFVAKQTALAAKKKFLRHLDEKYQAKRRELVSEGGARLEFEFAQQELQRALGALAMLTDRAAQVSAEMVAPGRPEVYRQATPPAEPVHKYPLAQLLAAGFGGFALPFGIAFLWESSVRRISSIDQLESNAEMQVIGEISRLSAHDRRSVQRSGRMGRELGLFEESIDSLRTGLILSNENHNIQVLAVTSAVPGEGKTSIASQLAVSLARSTGQPVLLIDGDLRAPDIHQVFGLPLAPGLSEVLAGTIPLDEAIVRTWSENLHLLPAGLLEENPHKLFGRAAIQSVLEEARLEYHYIVIDTPPILGACESLVLAKHADGTLVCAMRDYSREHHVRLAHRRLQATGVETLGTVLNGVPVRSYAYRYGIYGAQGYAGATSS